MERTHGHSPTYRDPEDPKDSVIKLNSYLGLDDRGHRALYGLKTMCKTKYTDGFGNRTGRGILGTKVGKCVDLSNSPPRDKLEEHRYTF